MVLNYSITQNVAVKDIAAVSIELILGIRLSNHRIYLS